MDLPPWSTTAQVISMELRRASALTPSLVTSGLKAGEQVVVDGVNQLTNGMTINPITPKQATDAQNKAKADLKDGQTPFSK